MATLGIGNKISKKKNILKLLIKFHGQRQALIIQCIMDIHLVLFKSSSVFKYILLCYEDDKQSICIPKVSDPFLNLVSDISHFFLPRHIRWKVIDRLAFHKVEPRNSTSPRYGYTSYLLLSKEKYIFFKLWSLHPIVWFPR